MPWLRRLTLAAFFLCFLVVVLGAYVRLSDAGLGCPDWPGCYGKLIVPAAQERMLAEEMYPERPLETDKAWKEMVHRYAASTLGLLIVLIAMLSRRVAEAPRRLPLFLVALVVFQGILGMWTVTWQLKPLAVSAHLLGGMGTLALLLLLWLRLGPRGVPEARRARREPRSERHAWFELQGSADLPQAPRLIRSSASFALLLLVGQIFLGGWTSSNYAALACPDLPKCHGQWLPDTDVREAFTLWRGLGQNYEFGVLDNRARMTIHLAHRAGALALTVVLLLLAAQLLRFGTAPWRGLGVALLAALMLQVGLGISIVLLQLPLALATAHNAGAALLLSTLVVLAFQAWRRTPA